MKLKYFTVSVACVMLAAPFVLAESPLVGNWKFNKEKSKLSGDTITFAAAASGSVRVTGGGMSYSFKPDGSDATNASGGMSAWSKVDDSTWREVVKINGKVIVTNTYKLGRDGKTMNISSQGTKPNGDAMNDSADYTRVLGAKGFMGKWKSVKVDASMVGYVIKDSGDGSLTWQLPDLKAEVSIRPDGKDATPRGPTVPPGFTLSLTKAGPKSFVLVQKMNGKPLVKATETISADGKMLTEHGSSVGVSEPFTAVYDKQ